MKIMNPYHQLIREATGAKIADCSLIEKIMRDVIFHSTLDWQTREQLVSGARQAQQELMANKQLYEQEHQLAKQLFNEMNAEELSKSKTNTEMKFR